MVSRAAVLLMSGFPVDLEPLPRVRSGVLLTTRSAQLQTTHGSGVTGAQTSWSPWTVRFRTRFRTIMMAVQLDAVYDGADSAGTHDSDLAVRKLNSV